MSEDRWDAMRADLQKLTVKQLRQIAKDEGICLGYATSRKDTTIDQIVGNRRYHALYASDEA